jgi:hypothetical protein
MTHGLTEYSTRAEVHAALVAMFANRPFVVGERNLAFVEDQLSAPPARGRPIVEWQVNLFEAVRGIEAARSVSQALELIVRDPAKYGIDLPASAVAAFNDEHTRFDELENLRRRYHRYVKRKSALGTRTKTVDAASFAFMTLAGNFTEAAALFEVADKRTRRKMLSSLQPFSSLSGATKG